MNAQVLAVLFFSWLVSSTCALLLTWYKVKPFVVYCVYAGIGLLTGWAFNWAYDTWGSARGWIMLAVCSLLCLQGAWVTTSVIPRWLAAKMLKPNSSGLSMPASRVAARTPRAGWTR